MPPKKEVFSIGGVGSTHFPPGNRVSHPFLPICQCEPGEGYFLQNGPGAFMCAHFVHIMRTVWASSGTFARQRPITRVRFSSALPVFKDDYAITITDDESDPLEQRFVSMGMGVKGRVLVVVYTYRGRNIRIISARLAEGQERGQYEEAR